MAGKIAEVNEIDCCWSMLIPDIGRASLHEMAPQSAKNRVVYYIQVVSSDMNTIPLSSCQLDVTFHCRNVRILIHNHPDRVPSQLVTASFQSLTSCSRVPPKWSTNTSPSIPLSRAILSGLIMRVVADSNEIGSILTYIRTGERRSERRDNIFTLPDFLSSGEKWLIGGVCSLSFFSMPLSPNKKTALRA